jgi:F0F1-type ATP synthase assembly protein I
MAIMSTIFSASALTFVYIGVLVLALLLIGTSLVTLARSFTAGSQSRTQRDMGFTLLRAAGFSLGVGALVFGVVGLLTERYFGMSPTSSVLWSLAAGLMIGFGTQILLVWRSVRREGEELEITYDIAGREAEVIIAVPADGLGEIAFQDDKGLIHLGAHSAGGRPIAAGMKVIIERVARNVAIVRPADESVVD